MTDLVTPDSLDVLDRRVYDLAVSRAPLAQIAVQLGVTVSQAEERIERVCARLGVADRVALREWAPRAVSESAEALETDAEQREQPSSPRRLSRRALLGAAGAVGALAAAGGSAAWWRRRDDGDSEAQQSGNAVEPTATPTAEPEQVLITPVPFRDAWEVKTFAKGELIDWPHGLFLMGLVGGEVRAHRLKTEQVYEYRTWPGGRFVAVTDGSQTPTTHLMDILNVETSWSWPYLKLQLIAVAGTLPTAMLVFERREENKGTGDLILLRSSRPAACIEPFAAVTVPSTGFNTPVLISPNGDAVAVVSAGGPRLVVTIIDAATGEVRGTYDPGLSATSADVGFVLDAFQTLDGGDYFLLAWHLVQQGRGEWMRGFTKQFRWDGGGTTETTFHDHAASFSADGKLYVREIALRDAEEGFADGPREYWPAVEIVETGSGSVAQRIRSASVYYGDGNSTRRSSDAFSFVGLVRASATPDGYDAAHFVRSLLPGWEIYERFAFPGVPDLEGQWFQSPWVQGVVPSPENPYRVALGRFAVLDLRNGQIVTANVRTDSGPAHIDPWAAGLGWLTFSFPHLGHGGASPPVLLQPKFESRDTPIESPLRFKVSAQGDRLNLRDQPSLSGKVIAALEDGSALTQAEDAARPAGRRGLEQGKGGTWVYVRTPGGIEGWVNSAYLAWP